MALSETSNQSDQKSQDSKHMDKKSEKLPTKIVIRRLPPTMDQETLLNQISPVPNYDYMYLVKGDMSLGENAFARAYINFVNPNDVFDFKEKFDNYVFLDSAGHEYAAVVEFAAFQKIPKKRNKIRVDHKCGTIESDLAYLEFVEMLNKPIECEEKPEYSYQLNTENKDEATTPLLEYIKNKRAEKMRIREERREDRKRKEFERKKFRDEERKKKFDDKSPNKKPQIKHIVKEGETDKLDKTEIEKESNDDKPTYKGKEKKFEDKKRDLKYKYGQGKKEYGEKREFKRKDDYKDYKNKYDDYKKDNEMKTQQKKAKKYSEKREENKRIEAQKAEQKKLEEQNKNTDKVEIGKETEDKKGESEQEIMPKNKDNDAQQRRIRNKDRPTIAIYRPGMLSKRKHVDGSSENKESRKE